MHAAEIAELIAKYTKYNGRRKPELLEPGTYSLVKEPVHICWGDAEAVSPAKVALHLKEHVCPRARLTLMPGVGHFCQLSDPDMWLASVAAFYNEECGLGGRDRMK